MPERFADPHSPASMDGTMDDTWTVMMVLFPTGEPELPFESPRTLIASFGPKLAVFRGAFETDSQGWIMTIDVAASIATTMTARIFRLADAKENKPLRNPLDGSSFLAMQGIKQLAYLHLMQPLCFLLAVLSYRRIITLIKQAARRKITMTP